MFCPKCGSLMVPKIVKKKKVIACVSCGYIDKSGEKIELKENTEKDDNISVVDKEIETLPETEVECPKCHNKTAYYWTVQTRAGDEPETKFYKCKKCKHIWRDYS